jgi:methyl-accepting chemotaxis protein
LDNAWQTDRTIDAAFEFRALAENAYNVINETIEKIDELASRTVFVGVNDEIKNIGTNIRKILKDTKLLLEEHKDFLEWRQPEK